MVIHIIRGFKVFAHWLATPAYEVHKHFSHACTHIQYLPDLPYSHVSPPPPSNSLQNLSTAHSPNPIKRIMPKQTLILPQFHMRHRPIPTRSQHLCNLTLLPPREQYIACTPRISVGWFASADRPLTKSSGGPVELVACVSADALGCSF